ncbi:hypothetical protein LJR084_003541 [Variovorax sp. LjRoot84]
MGKFFEAELRFWKDAAKAAKVPPSQQPRIQEGDIMRIRASVKRLVDYNVGMCVKRDGRHEGLQGDRGNQQGLRGVDRQRGRLRPGCRPFHGRAGTGQDAFAAPEAARNDFV